MTTDVGARREDLLDTAPLGVAQAELWRSPVVDLPVRVMRLSGELDVPALQRALVRVVQRHEGLRVVVRTEAGGPVQHLAGGGDCCALALAEATPPADPVRLAVSMVGTADRLAAGQSITAALVRSGGQEHVLALGIHPTAVDEWSWQVLIRDLAQSYTEEWSHGPAPAEPASYGALEAARWQARRQDSGAWDDHARYWRTRLADSPPRLAFPATGEARGHGEHLVRWLPPAEATAMAELGGRLGVPQWILMLLPYACVVGSVLRTDDLTVGVPAAGLRTVRQLVDSVGRLNGMLPVPFSGLARMGFAQAAIELKRTAQEDYAHQELPFALAMDAEGRRTPVTYSLRYTESDPPPWFGAARTELVRLDDPPAPFDLRLAVGVQADTVRLCWSHDPGGISKPLVSALADAYEALVAAVVQAPDTPLGSLGAAPLLPADRAAGRPPGRRRRDALVRIVPVRTRRGGPTLVMAPPIGGGAMSYAPLAKALDDQISLVSFELTNSREAGVPQMAGEALAALGELGSAPGTVFGGWSAGGVIAHEMARQAAASSRELAPVVLLDAEPHLGPAPDRADLLTQFAAELGLQPQWSDADLAEADEMLLLRRLFQELRAGGVRQSVPFRLLESRYRLFCRNFRAYAEHRPVYHAGAVHLLAASHGRAAPLWRPVADRLYIHLFGGDHYSIMRPPTVTHVAGVIADITLDHWRRTGPSGRPTTPCRIGQGVAG